MTICTLIVKLWRPLRLGRGLGGTTRRVIQAYDWAVLKGGINENKITHFDVTLCLYKNSLFTHLARLLRMHVYTLLLYRDLHICTNKD